MNYILGSILIVLLLISSCVDDESQPIGDLPFNPISGFDTTSTAGTNPIDTSIVLVDSCYERISTLRTLGNCPPYVGGFLNGLDFSALADVTAHNDIAPNHTAINIRSYRAGAAYAFDLGLTMNGRPESGRVYPLTTNGDALDGWHIVSSDSVYVVLGLYLDFADLNPPLAYKFAPGLDNWVRVDSSSYGIYEGESVTDHFGAMEATLVLNETEFIQDNVQFYLDEGFCVPDTIFLRDICFDARTRDVFSSCDRVPGR
jgi:hypothetical protein